MPALPLCIVREDIEFIATTLLEQERPLPTATLARMLIEARLEAERAALQERFREARFYNPVEAFTIGERVVFPALDFAVGTIVGLRDGIQPDSAPFTVAAVEFAAQGETDGQRREFATCLAMPHALGESDTATLLERFTTPHSADELLAEAGEELLEELEEALQASDNLVRIAGEWFLRDLLLEVDVGHLNLAEAVLDISGGGPLATSGIIAGIGGIEGPPGLQEFSMNHALGRDARFDEVGPLGDVLWYLQRMEPEEVQQIPEALLYSGIAHDRALLDDDMLDLEAEIDDELSPLRYAGEDIQSAPVTLIYPHRRLGTLPLNARLRTFFPTARMSDRIFVTLVDAQDGEEFTGWIARQERFVYGLGDYYRKHLLPVGAWLEVSQDAPRGRILLHASNQRPRSEWIRLITPREGRLTFEEARRSIGARFDELMVMGVEHPGAVDTLAANTRRQQRPLAHTLRAVFRALTPLSPQGTTHIKTLYSAVNILRRCPPGPLMAILVANPEFENPGGQYWRLRTEQETS